MIISHSDAMTHEYGIAFGKRLADEWAHCPVVAFFGPLGAGKTTLIRAMIQGISGHGNEHLVSSPTFVYLNEYLFDKGMIYHFDLYRLQSSDEFVEAGFEEYFYSEGICLIEWAERIETILPKNALKIYLYPRNETTREIRTVTVE